ncbi:hypothetical protein QYF61_000077 [Mycteria americana]|uniref:Uncharacterized protein n=1 Tax=Mycteria americana TaxID=33587 RepID=A0AAN7PCL3_MYCAM|nr:hypothetical protein QYF61_000077 [Mycteria americana]
MCGAALSPSPCKTVKEASSTLWKIVEAFPTSSPLTWQKGSADANKRWGKKEMKFRESSTRRTSRFSARWSHLMFALISGRLGSYSNESDALAAGSCKEEASRDPDSLELLNFFLTSNSATGSEITGWGQL